MRFWGIYSIYFGTLPVLIWSPVFFSTSFVYSSFRHSLRHHPFEILHFLQTNYRSWFRSNMNLLNLYHFASVLLLLHKVNAFFNHNSNEKGHFMVWWSDDQWHKADYEFLGITTSQLESLARLHHHKQQFHSDALAVISSLQIPETCLHSTLTESLISKCSTSPDSIEGVEKIIFATKLAICEFKAADVQYPRECNDKLYEEWEVKRCVRKLEGRPQWWTSWSNCLQNIGVICQAVRHKADQGIWIAYERKRPVLKSILLISVVFIRIKTPCWSCIGTSRKCKLN